jgi:uncharacterized protein YndB with AHSA1/START domain
MKIEIEAQVNAPIAIAWSAYTGPQHITQWNFASDDWHCPRAENDLRVGGRYFARMEAKDGSFGFDFEAHYSAVTPHQMLAYVMGDGREVRTTFEAHGGATKVTTVFDAETQNSIEMQRDGWQAILNSFATYAAGISRD